MRLSNFFRYLISQPGIDIEAKDGKGETALHVAAGENQSDAIINLIRGGANVNSPNSKSMLSNLLPYSHLSFFFFSFSGNSFY
jgi:ankyrin repeat protein